MLGLLQHILQDTRAALRGFRRHPALPVTAILACALGVGATTAVFSVVDRILFRPLPYADGDSLVSVGLTAPLDKHEFMFAGGYFDLRRHPGPLKNVTSFQAGLIPCDLTENQPERLSCLRVESNFLETLGVPPALGRSFLSEEDIPNGPRVAMISYGLWRSRFGGDPHAIGRTIQLDGATAVVVGVLPRDLKLRHVPALTSGCRWHWMKPARAPAALFASSPGLSRDVPLKAPEPNWNPISSVRSSRCRLDSERKWACAFNRSGTGNTASSGRRPWRFSALFWPSC